MLVVVTSLLLLLAPSIHGHGRLIQPPARSTAWRYGFPTPPNYNDHEIYCGGFGRQYGVNKGKCGVCGDPWDTPVPRSNEGGGKYGLGVITATYKEGSEVELGIELTANHNGYFEFRLCPHNDAKRPVSMSCLEENVLQRADDSGERYYPGPGSRKFYMRYQLPSSMTCAQCVLQWRYITASNWGRCPNGTGIMGCGPQEEFRACADITIVRDDGSSDATPSIPDVLPDPTDEDYNEVDTDRQHDDGNEEELSAESNFPGHVIALTLAFVLLPLLLLAIILYFYCAKEKVRSFYKKHANFCSKKISGSEAALDDGTTASTKTEKDLDGATKLEFPNPPHGGAPPRAPPRRHRRNSSSSNDISPSSEGTTSSYPNPV